MSVILIVLKRVWRQGKSSGKAEKDGKGLERKCEKNVKTLSVRYKRNVNYKGKTERMGWEKINKLFPNSFLGT